MTDCQPKSTMDMSDSPVALGGDWAKRTMPDATCLLLEFARALRGFSFYSENDAQRRPLLERAYRALSSELERAGTIDMTLGEEGFSILGLPDRIASNGVLGQLDSALRGHEIFRLRVDPDLTQTALHAFLNLLDQPIGQFESPECFGRSLAARDSSGLRLNDIDNESRTRTPKLRTTSPRALASIGPMQGHSSARPSSASTTPIDMAHDLDRHPLEASASDDRGERLRARLIELDRTLDDASYRQRAGDITVWGRDLWNEELIDECYRALLVLADHAVGCGGRPEAQARTAATCFAELATGDRLDDLIRRATDSDRGRIRAAQLLLQLGASAVPAIFDQLCSHPPDDRIAPLRALVLALGEASLPTLRSAIESYDGGRARVGIRLAGELQNPAVLPALVKALPSADSLRRSEIIHALSFLPGKASRQALARALENYKEEMNEAR